MYRVEKSTAERRVDSKEAKTWKSRVSVTIRRVRSRFGSLRLAVVPAWTADSGGSGGRGLGPTCMELALSVTNLRCSSAEGEMIVKLLKQSLSLFLSWCLLLTAAPGAFAQQADPSTSQPPVQATQSQTPVQAAKQTPEQLQQLVAPIALYPDALVAQVLAASTYPDQIVEADRWLHHQTDLKGEQLGQEVDKQPWDPSVKALTEFPSVLANMDKNLSWTSSLGDAYVNQPQEVMDAVQVMRDRAEKAGNLKSTSQEKVSNEGTTIVIEPADPEIVYLPEYDPWLVYGEPIGVWPGWYWYPGLYLTGPGIAFGLGRGLFCCY